MSMPGRITILILGLAAIAAIWWWARAEAGPTPAQRERDGRPPAAVVPAAAAAVPAESGAPAPRAGESRTEVASSPPTAIHGVLLRNGRPVDGREVVCIGATSRYRATATTGSDGSYRFEVPAGKYVLEIPVAAGTTYQQSTYSRWPADGPALLRAGWRRVEVLDADLRCDFALPGGVIAARALDAVHWQPIPHATFVWRPPPPTMEELHRSGDASGAVRLLDAVAGRHVVTARARGYRAARVELEVTNQQVAADLRLEPTGAIDVALVDEAGQALEISAAQKVSLLGVQTGGVIHEPSNEDAFRATPRPRAFEFDDVLPGQYWVALPRDEERDTNPKTVRFQPVEAIGVGEVEAIAGTVQRVEVPVRSRCHAELTALDRWGNRSDADLRLEWLDAQNGAAEVLPAPWSPSRRGNTAHFAGYLAPGTYAVSFGKGEQTHRETLVVDRLPVRRSYRMPW